jgi:hypothetical protein
MTRLSRLNNATISLILMSTTESAEEDWKEEMRIISVVKQREIVFYTPNRGRQ